MLTYDYFPQGLGLCGRPMKHIVIILWKGTLVLGLDSNTRLYFKEMFRLQNYMENFINGD